MNRREFFLGLNAAGTVLVADSLLGDKKEYTYGGGEVVGFTNLPTRITPHYFDWSINPPGGEQSPFTTDPQYEGKLGYGRQNVVTVDGKEIEYVTRFLTGPHGWVEEQVKEHCLTAEGKPYTRPLVMLYDRWDRVYITEEEARSLKWQCYVSDITSPHYGKKRYEERIVKRIHRGLVEFRIDESRRTEHGNPIHRGGANDQSDGKGEGEDTGDHCYHIG